MEVTLKKEHFLNSLQTPLKASNAINFSSFNNAGILLLQTSSNLLQIFGYSSAIVSLSEIFLEGHEELENRRILVDGTKLSTLLRKTKTSEISIEILESSLRLVGEGIYEEGEYVDISASFPFAEIDNLRIVDVSRISNKFAEALKKSAKFPYEDEIQQGLSGIGIYKGYSFGIQRKKGIILKLSEMFSIEHIFPIQITNVFPPDKEIFGTFDKVAILLFKNTDKQGNEYGETKIKFSMLNYKFPEVYGDTLLKYINLPNKGEIIFLKKQIKDMIDRAISVTDEKESFAKFEFEDDNTFMNITFTGLNNMYTEVIPIDVKNFSTTHSFKINLGLLRDMINFSKGTEKFTIYTHPDFRFDLPFLVNHEEDWMYISIKK